MSTKEQRERFDKAIALAKSLGHEYLGDDEREMFLEFYKAAEAATVERCAKVVDGYVGCDILAAKIRELKGE